MLLLASLVSRLGDSLYEIALVWVVLETTGDPALVSLAVIANLVPSMVAGIPAGALVDRLNKKHVMIVSDIVRGIAVLAIPLVGQHTYFIAVVLGVAFVVGIFDSVFKPARSALVPSLVPDEQLDAANGIMETANSVSRMFYAIGGIAIGLTGSFAVFYLNSASFFASALLLAPISRRAAAPTAHERDPSSGNRVVQLLADVRDGLAYLVSDSVLVSIVLLYVIYGVTIGPFGIVLPVYTQEVLNGSSFTYGLLYGGIYLGIFIGGIVLSRFDTWVAPKRGAVSTISLVFSGLMLLGLGAVPTHTAYPSLVSGAALVLYGFFAVGIWAPTRTLIQTIVPDSKLGRVFSIVGVAASTALPLGVAVAGPLLEIVDSGVLFVGEGVVLVIAGVVLSATPLARRTWGVETDHGG